MAVSSRCRLSDSRVWTKIRCSLSSFWAAARRSLSSRWARVLSLLALVSRAASVDATTPSATPRNANSALNSSVVNGIAPETEEAGPGHHGDQQDVERDDQQPDESDRQPMLPDPRGRAGLANARLVYCARDVHAATALRARATASAGPRSSGPSTIERCIELASLPARTGAANDVPLQTAKPEV